MSIHLRPAQRHKYHQYADLLSQIRKDSHMLLLELALLLLLLH